MGWSLLKTVLDLASELGISLQTSPFAAIELVSKTLNDHIDFFFLFKYSFLHMPDLSIYVFTVFYLKPRLAARFPVSPVAFLHVFIIHSSKGRQYHWQNQSLTSPCRRSVYLSFHHLINSLEKQYWAAIYARTLHNFLLFAEDALARGHILHAISENSVNKPDQLLK